MRHWRRIKKILFVLPGMAGTILFYFFPLCYCFIYAFSATPGRFTFGGLENYGSLLHSDSFLLALGNTWLLMLACVGALILLSLFFVYLLDASKGVMAVLLVFSLPMLLPAALITRCMEGVAISPRIMLLSIYLWKYTGFHVLLLKMMELTMSPEWIEAAVLEHAGKWQVFCRIKCWYLWPYIRFLLIFDGICFFRLFRESYLLYGEYPPGEVYVVSNFFFNNFQNLNYQRLSAAAIAALIPILVLNVILLKVGRKHEMV